MSKALPFIQRNNLTPWYPGGVRPVRPGVYQRRHHIRPDSLPFAYWTGKYWGLLAGTVKQAERYAEDRSSWQELEWRGIFRSEP